MCFLLSKMAMAPLRVGPDQVISQYLAESWLLVLISLSYFLSPLCSEHTLTFSLSSWRPWSTQTVTNKSLHNSPTAPTALDIEFRAV